ncbi:hypothetical protein SSTU70S_00903 [Stutzerimonas stutzeri]
MALADLSQASLIGDSQLIVGLTVIDSGSRSLIRRALLRLNLTGLLALGGFAGRWRDDGSIALACLDRLAACVMILGLCFDRRRVEDVLARLA